jgi:pimeloyl-ACP methyl ester carboxylesterase
MMHPRAISLAEKLRGWFGKAALAVVVVSALLACVGATYQIVGTWRDGRRFPQRGRSFQVGNVKLNLDCSGQGSPTVILDGGMGSPALDWIRVQPEVAKFTRVCSYDRAGYGWSEASPEPRTSAQIVKELRALISAAGESSPFILVGHSFGGFNMRVFNGKYPADVAGVVLVDASHEDEDERIGSVLSPTLKAREKRDQDRREKLDRILTPFLIHLGLQRLALAAGWASGQDASRLLSRDLQEEFLYLEQQTKYLDAIAAEDKSSSQSGDQARAAGGFGDKPLIVLTAGRPYDPEELLTKEQMAKQRDIWINVLQVEEAHLSTRGKQIVVPDSSHDIPGERPDAVVSAIKEVWSTTRKIGSIYR